MFVNVSENAVLYYTCNGANLKMLVWFFLYVYVPVCHFNILGARDLSGLVRSCPLQQQNIVKCRRN